MMRLLIDLGNTRIKLAWRDAAGLNFLEPVTHRDSDWPERLLERFEKISQPEQIWISSVAHPIMTGAMLERIKHRFGGAEIRMAESNSEMFGVRIAYRDPKKFGVDRNLAMIAAHARRRCNQIVIGCGTALTIDAIDADGKHAGGLIVAAPILMRSALMAEVGRIHLQREGQVCDLADNTDDALTSGSILAAAALIERTAEVFRNRTQAEVSFIAHGGGWPMVEKHCRLAVQYVPDLVLEGLDLYTQVRN